MWIDNLKEYLPLQQGLRLLSTLTKEAPLKEYLPLQQGLRLRLFHSFLADFPSLKEYLPLQQGLRPERAHAAS